MRKATTVAMGGSGGGGKGVATTTDLLVCFPARQRLALMPKPICSPSRATMERRRAQAPGPRSSPMFRGSNKAKRRADEDEEEEPQSPKVTCAGQIKVGRPKKAATRKQQREKGKSWITVVEEIERMHGRRKKVGWLEAVGIRRDALPFLGGVLRSLRHKARCLGFGSLHGAADSSTDDDEDGDGAEEEEHGDERKSAATSVFSKWLMVLDGGEEPSEKDSGDDDDQEERRSEKADECASAPPPNALLLMRCRSAPAKGLSRRGAALEQPAGEAEEEKGSAHAVAGDAAGTEEDRDDLVFMSTAPGFLKLSIDIAKETWIVGGGGDPFSRSRSWKR
ncbi:hypothetical protein PR202_gb22793 [Eleusine coracana subsp. coracana]|uniref:Uncharacterized protein n=1 Tax=Eleusine coracana subsp. coracana TaxID=191504 RepID=A0AAV5FI65_ELECO|nr:hypothetical protein PR202_gb22793 [Eleusine coracana subsp. coracana]